MFDELCEEQINMYIEPELVKNRKNKRKIKFEVENMKRKIDSAGDSNVVLSNREIRLLRYLKL